MAEETGIEKKGNEEEMEKIETDRERERERKKRNRRMSHQAVTELVCLSDGLLYSLLSNTQGDCERLCHTVS